MRPLARPATLGGGAALVLTAGIVSNALFLQPGRHPAPLFFAPAEVAEPATVQPDALVEAIQAALRDAAIYVGPVDGIAGPQTIAAIGAFEKGAGRTPTGRASPELLEAILSSAAAPVEAEAAVEVAVLSPPSPAEAAPDDRVAIVQGALSRAAYGQITADGVFGPQTRDAIRRFQADHGLPLTGEIDDALIVELRAAGALAE
jgi:peptidoglycan hydrolase-like protein with peptidoglycan-binding domain